MSTSPKPALKTREIARQAEEVKRPAPADPKLKVSNLNFYYGSYQALHDISLEMAPNRVTALIGPSGCGKSTFLRTMNRIHETIRNVRLDGKIVLDNEDVFELDVTALRRRVGMVFQRPNPFPKSIADNIAYGAAHERPRRPGRHERPGGAMPA